MGLWFWGLGFTAADMGPCQCGCLQGRTLLSIRPCPTLASELEKGILKDPDHLKTERCYGPYLGPVRDVNFWKPRKCLWLALG